jgi:hypothetical protein
LASSEVVEGTPDEHGQKPLPVPGRRQCIVVRLSVVDHPLRGIFDRGAATERVFHVARA